MSNTYNRYYAEVQPDQIDLKFEIATFRCPPPDKELVKSIEKDGIITPVIVCQHPDFAYLVVKSGQRRILAANQLELIVPTLIYEDVHPDDTLAWIHILNYSGSENIIHSLYAINERVDMGASLQDLQKEFMMSKAQITNLLELTVLDEEIIEAVISGTVTQKTAQDIARKSRKYPDIVFDAIDVLKDKGKIPGTWVTNYSRKSRQDAVRSLFDMQLPSANVEEDLTQYALFDGDDFIGVQTGYQEARSAFLSIGKEAELYRLIPVEVK